MFHPSSKPQVERRGGTPDPVFARHLRQAVGGIEALGGRTPEPGRARPRRGAQREQE